VTGDLGFPEQQRYIEKVEELEAYQQQQHYKYVQEVPECTTPPEFKSPITVQNNIREGGFAHFEARLTQHSRWSVSKMVIQLKQVCTNFLSS
jgi:hypothetical protein